MKRLYILTVCSLILAITVFLLNHRKANTSLYGSPPVLPAAWLTSNNKSLTPAKDRRPADQTFLTFPEWYLVFSPDEQARYFSRYTSTSFPFVAHINQIWKSYRLVKGEIGDHFPPNKGYHFMIWVIGSSATAEYAVKSWYEHTVGALTDTHEAITDEDKFNAAFTADYVKFINDRPWYEYDFTTALQQLWTSNSFTGDHLIRKLDRRYILTTELLFKAIYGKLIKLGTGQIYETAVPTTAVITSADSLVYLPRYNRFAEAALQLYQQTGAFKEIAGNRSAILVSVLKPDSSILKYSKAIPVFEQPLAAEPGRKRVVLATLVSDLGTLLTEISNQQLTPEHVFDY